MTGNLDMEAINLANCHVSGSLLVEAPARIVGGIYGNVTIGAFTYTNGSEIHEAEIGRFCSIAPGVIIGPGEHPTSWLSSHAFVCDLKDQAAGLGLGWRQYLDWLGAPPLRKQPIDAVPRVVVGHDVWIGARAIVRAGVHIGHGAVIGASAVVTKDVPPYAIVTGVPARIKRFRFNRSIRGRLLKLQWWNLDLSRLTGRIDYSDVVGSIDLIEKAIVSGEVSRLRPVVYEAVGSEKIVRDCEIAWSSQRMHTGSTWTISISDFLKRKV